VDGNDVLAVYRATRQALERARSGNGPTFIECLTYRMGDHTTADDAERYRSPGEVAAWAARDPILRLERFMAARGLWDDGYGTSVKAGAEATVDDAVKGMESVPPPSAAELFDHTAATLTPRQSGQREGL
jgi:pyruvate dehydrogenase E1 component alpha subunit